MYMYVKRIDVQQQQLKLIMLDKWWQGVEETPAAVGMATGHWTLTGGVTHCDSICAIGTRVLADSRLKVSRT